MTSSKTLIAIVGLPASGKSTAIESVTEFGPIVIMGDVVRDETEARTMAPTPKNIGRVAQSLRKEFGLGIIAQRCVEKINSINGSVIFIDGIRSEEEVILFRKNNSLYVIAITCPNPVRFNRIKSRGRSDDTIDMDLIRQRDQRELQWGLSNVIEHADYTIGNDSDKASLQKKIQNLIQGLI